jgi:hypothetical protein
LMKMSEPVMLLSIEGRGGELSKVKGCEQLTFS